MSRRNPLASVELQASTHAGLWLDRYLADLTAAGSKQAHIARLGELRASPAYPLFFERSRAALAALPATVLAKLTVRGRMAVGLGAESVLETSVCLHRTYGVPTIPGSALKGLAAAAAHRHLESTAWRKAAAGQPIGASHRLLFGDLAGSGLVTFHDALWWPDDPMKADADPLPLDLDVITVHHGSYYLGRDVPPADWDDPVPVAFASARGSYLLALTGPTAWVDAALAILQDALDQDGIGAKTAAGYGRMNLVREKSWQVKVEELTMGNAERDIPPLLAALEGKTREEAAQAILQAHGRNLRKPAKRALAWVQALYRAAGEEVELAETGGKA